MMNKLKKWVAGLLAVVSCFSLFACGETNSTGNNSATSDVTNSGDSSDSTSTPEYTGPKEEVQIYFWRSG